MLAIERINTILQILAENGSVMVSDLSKQLGVSEETIRRDFEKLEKEKRIRRVHGGACPPAALRGMFRWNCAAVFW